MKVLLINGSPNANGCTYTALSEAAGTLNGEGIDTEIFQIGKAPVQGCIDCRRCAAAGRCAFTNDQVSAALDIAKGSDGFIFGSPVYYAAASGQMTSLMNRLFFCNRNVFSHKPGASVVCCRRAGSTASG